MRNCTRPASRSDLFSSVSSDSGSACSSVRILAAITLIGALLAVIFPAGARAQSRWPDRNRVVHFVGNFIATSVSYSVAANSRSSEWGIETREGWFSPDKYEHSIGIFLLSCVTYTIAAYAYDVEHRRARNLGVAAGTAVSLGKELYDTLFGLGFDWEDIVWNGLGVGLAAINTRWMKPPSEDKGVNKGNELIGLRFGGMYLKGDFMSEIPSKTPVRIDGFHPGGSLPFPPLQPRLKAVDTTLHAPTLRSLWRY